MRTFRWAILGSNPLHGVLLVAIWLYSVACVI
jgi:hypothetical protein